MDIKPTKTGTMVKIKKKELNEYCSDLKTDSLTAMQWQQKIEELYSNINLEDLLKYINFDHLIKGFFAFI